MNLTWFTGESADFGIKCTGSNSISVIHKPCNLSGNIPEL